MFTGSHSSSACSQAGIWVECLTFGLDQLIAVRAIGQGSSVLCLGPRAAVSPSEEASFQIPLLSTSFQLAMNMATKARILIRMYEVSKLVRAAMLPTRIGPTTPPTLMTVDLRP